MRVQRAKNRAEVSRPRCANAARDRADASTPSNTASAYLNQRLQVIHRLAIVENQFKRRSRRLPDTDVELRHRGEE